MRARAKKKIKKFKKSVEKRLTGFKKDDILYKLSQEKRLKAIKKKNFSKKFQKF